MLRKPERIDRIVRELIFSACTLSGALLGLFWALETAPGRPASCQSGSILATCGSHSLAQALEPILLKTGGLAILGSLLAAGLVFTSPSLRPKR